MYIDFRSFAGMVPKVSPKLLGNNQAVTATNCDLQQGDLRPIMGMNTIQQITSPANPISIYKFGTSWLAWATDVDVARSVISSAETIYYTGDGVPKIKKSGDDARTLGVTAPAAAPTISIQDKGSGNPANVDDTVSYVYTYVTDYGEESAPSPATAVTDLYNDKKFQLGNLVASSQSEVTLVRIYRTSTSSTGYAEYQFLVEQSDTLSTYNDYDGSGDMNEVEADVLQTEDWETPDAGLSGLCEFTNGIFAAFTGNTLYFTEPFAPYAWPSKYALTFESDIIAIKPFNAMLIVLTGTQPHVVTGIDPESLAQQPLPFYHGCMSKRSTVVTPAGVVYASNDGLVITDGTTVSNLTEQYYTKAQWAALSPSTMIAFYYDDRIYLFNSASSTFIETTTSGISTGDITGNVYGGHLLPTDDKLYLITKSGSNYYVNAFKDSGSYLSYTYKTKTFQLSRPTKFGVCRVFGDFTAGNLTLKLYDGSTLKHTATVSTDGSFRLPVGYYTELIVQMEGKPIIESIELALSPQEFLS